LGTLLETVVAEPDAGAVLSLELEVVAAVFEEQPAIAARLVAPAATTPAFLMKERRDILESECMISVFMETPFPFAFSNRDYEDFGSFTYWRAPRTPIPGIIHPWLIDDNGFVHSLWCHAPNHWFMPSNPYHINRILETTYTDTCTSASSHLNRQ
jgi:hypothetical protein